jgi:hypothetical protein
MSSCCVRLKSNLFLRFRSVAADIIAHLFEYLPNILESLGDEIDPTRRSQILEKQFVQLFWFNVVLLLFHSQADYFHEQRHLANIGVAWAKILVWGSSW